MVIDNRSGGSGIIGMEIAARAAPDGYTILMSEVGTLSKATPVTTPRSGLACWCPKRQPNLS